MVKGSSYLRPAHEVHMKIGQLARQAQVGIDTVRYYERHGLLPEPQRQASGYRIYDAHDLERLRFIRGAKALGFSLEEIRELHRLSSAEGQRADVRALAAHRLQDVETRLRELQAIRDVLAELVTQCSGQGPIAGCPIMETVIGSNKRTVENANE